MNQELPRLDPLLHQPARTQIVAFLSGRGEATFNELKRALDITDGNLGAHLGKLGEAALVASREQASGARAQTVFSLTQSGRRALADYVAQLSALVQLSENGRTKASASPRSRKPTPKLGTR